jgi:hypothetical protein
VCSGCRGAHHEPGSRRGSRVVKGPNKAPRTVGLDQCFSALQLALGLITTSLWSLSLSPLPLNLLPPRTTPRHLPCAHTCHTACNPHAAPAHQPSPHPAIHENLPTLKGPWPCCPFTSPPPSPRRCCCQAAAPCPRTRMRMARSPSPTDNHTHHRQLVRTELLCGVCVLHASWSRIR